MAYPPPQCDGIHLRVVIRRGSIRGVSAGGPVPCGSRHFLRIPQEAQIFPLETPRKPLASHE
ncbi:hypothetical protein FM101_10125 [Arthrobacter rhombi]|uniref:Uncharacterized protein n=1 Tax=Arthrobacter rhombi TaxID=71253 RepID=A0A1R4GFK6_9MICC|nr:hypothetical protein FM101_10125 [Arthrobacter rhombi]